MATRSRADAADHGQAEAQQRRDESTSAGMLGTKVDPTPDHHYTVSGVGLPASTPGTV